MQIYQLRPTVTDAREWNASTFKGPVLVRAESEADARKLAGARYGITSRSGGSASPWTRGDLVQAAVMAQPRYPAQGRSMILEPLDQI